MSSFMRFSICASYCTLPAMSSLMRFSICTSYCTLSPRIQKCGLWPHPDKPRGLQGGAVPPLWHTTLLARCFVSYLLVRLPGKAEAVRFAHRFPRQENARGFVTERDQKLSVFRERQQVYNVPTYKRKYQYYLFIIFPTFLIEIDIVPFGLFINSMYSELSKKSEGIVISIPVSVLILCFLPSGMA